MQLKNRQTASLRNYQTADSQTAEIQAARQPDKITIIRQQTPRQPASNVIGCDCKEFHRRLKPLGGNEERWRVMRKGGRDTTGRQGEATRQQAGNTKQTATRQQAGII